MQPNSDCFSCCHGSLTDMSSVDQWSLWVMIRELCALLPGLWHVKSTQEWINMFLNSGTGAAVLSHGGAAERWSWQDQETDGWTDRGQLEDRETDGRAGDTACEWDHSLVCSCPQRSVDSCVMDSDPLRFTLSSLFVELGTSKQGGCGWSHDHKSTVNIIMSARRKKKSHGDASRAFLRRWDNNNKWTKTLVLRKKRSVDMSLYSREEEFRSNEITGRGGGGRGGFWGLLLKCKTRQELLQPCYTGRRYLRSSGCSSSKLSHPQ